MRTAGIVFAGFVCLLLATQWWVGDWTRLLQDAIGKYGNGLHDPIATFVIGLHRRYPQQVPAPGSESRLRPPDPRRRKRPSSRRSSSASWCGRCGGGRPLSRTEWVILSYTVVFWLMPLVDGPSLGRYRLEALLVPVCRVCARGCRGRSRLRLVADLLRVDRAVGSRHRCSRRSLIYLHRPCHSSADCQRGRCDRRRRSSAGVATARATTATADRGQDDGTERDTPPGAAVGPAPLRPGPPPSRPAGPGRPEPRSAGVIGCRVARRRREERQQVDVDAGTHGDRLADTGLGGRCEVRRPVRTRDPGQRARAHDLAGVERVLRSLLEDLRPRRRRGSEPGGPAPRWPHRGYSTPVRRC